MTYRNLRSWQGHALRVLHPPQSSLLRRAERRARIDYGPGLLGKEPARQYSKGN